MVPCVVEATPLGAFRLRLRFDDGAEGEVDLSKMIPFEGVFAPLKEPEYFGQVRADPESGTIVWPNGADLDPLVLHAAIRGVLLETAGKNRKRGSG